MIEIASKRLTMKQAAQYLGHSYSWLHSGHRSMGLSGYRIGGRWYFDLEDIKEWESNLKLQAATSGRSSAGRRSIPRKVNFI
jgi:excisionase family DNA binding protein